MSERGPLYSGRWGRRLYRPDDSVANTCDSLPHEEGPYPWQLQLPAAAHLLENSGKLPNVSLVLYADNPRAVQELRRLARQSDLDLRALGIRPESSPARPQASGDRLYWI